MSDPMSNFQLLSNHMLSPPFSPPLADMTLEDAKLANDKDDGEGSQKSNDSMAA